MRTTPWPRACIARTGGDDRGLDQEPGAALQQRADAGDLAGASISRCSSACRCWPSSCGTRGWAAHGLEWLGAGWILALLWLRTLFRFYTRVAKSNFPFLDCAISPLGLPLFVVLLYRSWFQHRILKRVSWKGRRY